MWWGKLRVRYGHASARSRKYLTHHTGMMILRTQYSGSGKDQLLAVSLVVKKYIGVLEDIEYNEHKQPEKMP